jgi:hypothetical protein
LLGILHLRWVSLVALGAASPLLAAPGFTAHHIDTQGEPVYAVVAHDIDEDGDIDVFTGGGTGSLGTVQWYENQFDTTGSQQFGGARLVHRRTSTSGAVATAINATDLDADGDFDLVATWSGISNHWYANDGAQTFTTSASQAIGNSGWSVDTALVDADAGLDVVTGTLASVGSGFGTVTWLRNRLPSSFSAEHQLTGTLGLSVDAVDVDGDGKTDVVAALQSFSPAGRISWIQNNMGSVPRFPERVIASGVDTPRSVHAVDFDRDGDIDVVAAVEGDDTIAWYEQQPPVSPSTLPEFVAHVISASAPAAQSVKAVDLEGDGDTDVVAALNGSDTIAWYENDGSQTFAEHAISIAASGASSVDVVDFDDDGVFEVLAGSIGGREITWYEANVVRIELDTTNAREADSSVITVRATTNQPVAADVTLPLSVTGAGITADDYALSIANLFIAAGTAGSDSATLTVRNDTDIEGTEVATIGLSAMPIGFVLSPRGRGMTIADDDGLVARTVALSMAATLSETDGALVTITATADGAVQGDQTVDLSLAGNALRDTDYTLDSATIALLDGQTTGTATLTVRGDSHREGDETVAVSLTNPSAGLALHANPDEIAETLTILDDDTVTLSIGDASIDEGDAGNAVLSFVVTADGATHDGFTLDFSTADGTAIAGEDYAASTGAVTFAAGELQRPIDVTIVGDRNFEPDETFTVTLNNAPAGVTLPDAAANGTIRSDDRVRTATLSMAATVSETDGTAVTVTVTADGPVQGDQTVDLSLAGSALRDTDYALALTTITLLDGQTTGTATLTLRGDTHREGDETVAVSLANPSAGLALHANPDEIAETLTIQDDDTVTLNIADASIDEGDAGNTVLSFVVTAGGATHDGFDIDFATADAGAVAGEDYGQTNGTLSLAAGVDRLRIDIAIYGDETLEQDEVFTLALSNLPAGVGLLLDTAQGRIQNDDSAAVSIRDVTIAEGDTGLSPARFVVTATGSVQGGFSVALETRDGNATAGEDYLTGSGTLRFAEGQTEGQFEVALVGDGLPEPDETFEVTLTSPSNGVTLGRASATATLTNDDAPPPTSGVVGFARTEITVPESVGDVVVCVQRLDGSTGAASVELQAVGIEAIEGTDYLGHAATVHWADGNNADIPVTFHILDDGVVEQPPEEALAIVLDNETGVRIDEARAASLITVQDDDPLPGEGFRDGFEPSPTVQGGACLP